MKKTLTLQSITTLSSPHRVEAKLLQMGFQMAGECLTVSDSRFWSRRTYALRDQAVNISEELGQAYYRDPVITICGTQKTIRSVTRAL